MVIDTFRSLPRFVIAALASFPFVGLLNEYGCGKPAERGAVREWADEVGAVFDLRVDPFQRVCGPDLPQCRCENDANERRSSWASSSIAATLEHFTAPICGNTNGDGDRLGHDPVVDPRFDIRRVEEHVQIVQGR